MRTRAPKDGLRAELDIRRPQAPTAAAAASHPKGVDGARRGSGARRRAARSIADFLPATDRTNRIVVFGTGTDVGKTYFATHLIRALASTRPAKDVVGVKPVETGVRRRSRGGAPPPGTDAHALETVSRGTPLRPHPLQAFRRAVSAHLAARAERRTVSVAAIARGVALHATTIHGWQIVETAGGVFSPLSESTTNFDLAIALEPAVWILVAPDALGVLHDVRATLTAMQCRGRVPDHLVLSAARDADASAGTNAAELRRVGLPAPIAVVGRASGSKALTKLVRQLLRTRPR